VGIHLRAVICDTAVLRKRVSGLASDNNLIPNPLVSIQFTIHNYKPFLFYAEQAHIGTIYEPSLIRDLKATGGARVSVIG
jgi:hypothetical protein